MDMGGREGKATRKRRKNASEDEGEGEGKQTRKSSRRSKASARHDGEFKEEDDEEAVVRRAFERVRDAHWKNVTPGTAMIGISHNMAIMYTTNTAHAQLHMSDRSKHACCRTHATHYEGPTGQEGDDEARGAGPFFMKLVKE